MKPKSKPQRAVRSSQRSGHLSKPQREGPIAISGHKPEQKRATRPSQPAPRPATAVKMKPKSSLNAYLPLNRDTGRLMGLTEKRPDSLREKDKTKPTAAMQRKYTIGKRAIGGDDIRRGR